MRAARRIHRNPARSERVERAAEEFALEHPEGGQIPRGPAPPRLGTPAQGTEARAGSIDEDPVVCRRLVLADLPTVAGAHLDPGVALGGSVEGGTKSLRDELGAVGRDFVGDQVGAALDGQRGEEAGLATRTGTEVQPALVLRAGFDRGRREGQGHDLTAGILHGRATVADRC